MSKANAKKAQDAVAASMSVTQGLTKELAGFADAVKAKEVQRGACEADVRVALRELDEHERRMTSEGLMRFSSRGQQCSICCNDIAADGAVLLGCGHGWYCTDCITRFV